VKTLKNGDKILTALGAIVTIAGMISAFYGNTTVGISGIAGGAGMIAKGCEEFYNGDSAQGTADVVKGAQEANTAAGNPAKVPT
jgi:hypothetical protein